jgi:hypothetical protein
MNGELNELKPRLSKWGRKIPDPRPLERQHALNPNHDYSQNIFHNGILRLDFEKKMGPILKKRMEDNDLWMDTWMRRPSFSDMSGEGIAFGGDEDQDFTMIVLPNKPRLVKRGDFAFGGENHSQMGETHTTKIDGGWHFRQVITYEEIEKSDRYWRNYKNLHSGEKYKWVDELLETRSSSLVEPDCPVKDAETFGL